MKGETTLKVQSHSVKSRQIQRDKQKADWRLPRVGVELGRKRG